MQEYGGVEKGCWYSSDGIEIILCISSPKLIQEVCNDKTNRFSRALFLADDLNDHMFGKALSISPSSKPHIYLTPSLQNLLVEDNIYYF